MPEDMTIRIQETRAEIDVRAEPEVRYWMDELHVTEEQLRIAVAEAGVSVADVKDHLGVV